MNNQEYKEVEKMTYHEYCDYLQNKYGKAKYDYMNENFVKNPKVTRTKEGLFVHHIMEDKVGDISKQERAKLYPYEYQKAENILYCDYLEHLLLHILISEETREERQIPGAGGVINYIVPILNDVYSGWVPGTDWQKNCCNKIIADKDVYLTLVKRFKTNCRNKNWYKEAERMLYRSFCEMQLMPWNAEYDKSIIEELKKL